MIEAKIAQKQTLPYLHLNFVYPVINYIICYISQQRINDATKILHTLIAY